MILELLYFWTSMIGIGMAATADAPQIASLPQPPSPSILPLTDDDLCQVYAIRLSPDGKFAAVESRPQNEQSLAWSTSGRISVIDLDCDAEEAVCRDRRISMPYGGSQPQWSIDGENLYVVAQNALGWPECRVAVSLNDERTIGSTGLPSGPYVLSTIGISGGVGSQPGWRLGRRSDDKQSAIGRYWVRDRYLGQLSRDRETFSLLHIQPHGRTVDLGITSTHIPDAALALDRAGRLKVVATGYLKDVASGLEQDRAAYARPIFEAVSGVLAGTMDRDRVVMEREDWQTLAAPINALLDERTDLFPVAVSVADEAQTLTAVVRAVAGDTVILTSHRGRPVERRSIACGTDQEAQVRVSVTRPDWGTSAHRLPVTLYEVSDATTLVVYAHGGPGLNEQDADVPTEVATLLKSGRSVAIIEASGSSGGGLQIADRLRANGTVAQMQDARLIANAIAALRSRYQNIGVMGMSFVGSLIPQQALAEADFLIAVAPFLQYIDPSEWSTIAPPRGQQDFQRTTDDTRYGRRGSPARVNYESMLSRNLATWSPERPVLIVVGEKDDLSPPSNVAALSANGRAEILVVPGAEHQEVFRWVEEKNAVATFLVSQGF